MTFLVSRVRRAMQILVCALAVTLNSCVYLVVGGVGAVGGYAISPDTVEGLVSGHEPAEVWSSATEVISGLGIIEEKNEAAGMMICKIQGAKVTVTVMRVSESTVKLTVKARKNFFPKIKIAEDVYLRVHKMVAG